MKVGHVIFFSFLAGLLVWLYMEYFHLPQKTVTVKPRGNFDIVTLKLPNSIDTKVFGRPYWESFHKLAEMVPCSICQHKAVSFMSFFHDVVNIRTGKSFYDRANFDKWVKTVSEMKSK